MRKKYFFFDIDGTLIDMQKKCISEKTLETLVRLKKNGILICLATGRTPLTVPHFEGGEFDAFLTFNGAYCYTEEEDISGNPIPTEDVRQIIENAAEIGRPVSVATKNRIAANGKDADLVEYYSFAKLEVDIPKDFEEVSQGDVYQIMLGCLEEDYPKLLKNVKHAKITSWWERAVDIIPAEGGKGAGIRKMLEYYGLDRFEAMAFGDGNNDIEMLKEVGIGVAMANASEQLKEAADEICKSVTEDGIYHYCLEHGLI